jgi:AraC-like DNA-binding protein
MVQASGSLIADDPSSEPALLRQKFLRGMFSGGKTPSRRDEIEFSDRLSAADAASLPSPQEMDLDVFKSYLTFRYKAPVQSAFFSKTLSKDPIAISRLHVEPCRTRAVAPEPGFAVIIYMSPTTKVEGWIDGRHVDYPAINAGDIVLLDLEASPVARLHEPVDLLRLQISRRTLLDLAYDSGERPPAGLRTILGGVNDPVLHGLSRVLEAECLQYGSTDQLFADHVALAFYAHIVKAYASGRTSERFTGGLAPWQSQRACEMMVANFTGEVALTDIAQACGLSVSYFARAFRKTMGVPPYRWLMRERVQRAMNLLRHTTLGLSEIALACGFADQSHLTRVFRSIAGQTPGRWRRYVGAVN